MATDFLTMHRLELPWESSWDEEVPQEVIDQDEEWAEQNRLAILEADRIARVEYEKNCSDFHIPTCPICRQQYDPFSGHYCNTHSGEQGGA